MTEPEGPRDPDLDVPPLSAYTFAPGPWMGSEGVGYGVRVALERADGARLVGSIDSPEEALRLARALERAALAAADMRAAATPAPARLDPLPEPVPLKPHPWRVTVEEARRRLDPKTCSGCGVVEGASFEPRHHPRDCPRLQEFSGQ